MRLAPPSMGKCSKNRRLVSRLWVIRRHRNRPRHVRFTPKSGHSAARLGCPLSAKSGHSQLFDHLVGGGENGLRYRETERLKSLSVDEQFKLDRNLHRQVRRLFTFDDATKKEVDQSSVTLATDCGRVRPRFSQPMRPASHNPPRSSA
jgi:hypothetical protein